MKKDRFIILLIAIAFISGFFWCANYGLYDKSEITNQTRHDEMALLILEKGVFNNGDIMNRHIDQPIYSVFLAGIFKVFGHNYQVVKIIQVLLFVLLAVLVYQLAQLIFNEKVARLAGLMTALCYSIASFTGWLYRDFFFCLMVFLMIYLLYQAQLKFKNIWFILAGLVTGLTVLTNGIIQFFLLLIIINFLVVNWSKGLKKIYPKLTMFFLAFALVVSPWVVSDYLNFGRLPFGSNEGLVLAQRVETMKAIEDKYFQHFIGNTLGDFFAYKWFSNYNPKESRLGWQTREDWFKALEQGQSRKEIDLLLTEEAKKEVLKHPFMFLKMTSIDFLKFYTPMVPNVEMQHMLVNTHSQLPDFVKGSIILFIRFVYLIFFSLVIYAIVKNIKNWSKISWLFLLILYFSLIFSLIIGLARFSMPLYPYYIILASWGLIFIWEKIKKKHAL